MQPPFSAECQQILPTHPALTLAAQIKVWSLWRAYFAAQTYSVSPSAFFSILYVAMFVVVSAVVMLLNLRLAKLILIFIGLKSKDLYKRVSNLSWWRQQRRLIFSWFLPQAYERVPLDV